MILSVKTTEEIVSAYSASPRFVRKLKKHGHTLPDLSTISHRARNSKRCSTGYYPLVENQTLNFVRLCRAHKLPVTLDIIRMQAEFLKEKLLLSANISDDTKAKLMEFKVSRGWSKRFAARHNITSKALNGCAASEPTEEAKEEMQIIRERLRQYPIDKILNVDETALFYKCLPYRTYVLSDENNRSLKGTKSMKAKSRITAILCANADGSLKIPVSIIGVSAQPRAFANK